MLYQVFSIFVVTTVTKLSKPLVAVLTDNISKFQMLNNITTNSNRAIPFEIPRGAEWKKNKNMWGWSAKTKKSNKGGVPKKMCPGFLFEEKLCQLAFSNLTSSTQLPKNQVFKQTKISLFLKYR